MSYPQSLDDNSRCAVGAVAVLDDDPMTRRLIRRWLETSGYSVIEYERGAEALEYTGPPLAAACIDLGLDDMSGMDVLEHLRARDPDLPLIVVSAQSGLETAVEAMRAGAYDYLVKPLERERLALVIGRAVEKRSLTADVQRLQGQLDSRRVLGSVVGESGPMRELASQVERILESDVNVCVFGESGTGKELVARAIHDGGQRSARPFVAINCAAIPESLQESELFGHERGAFTGATGMHRGRFEQAEGGTLFLDELGEMSTSTQASLLRTLQEKTIRRVGAAAEVPVDVRIVCATHQDLRNEVEEGNFREDLYFRLVVYPLQLAPLRERLEDIPLLTGHFMRSLADDVGRPVSRITSEALEALSRYSWPGNVRELQNVVHRSMLSSDGEVIVAGDLPPDIQRLALPSLPASAQYAMPTTPPGMEPEVVVPLRELERRAIHSALSQTGGSVSEAARLLGIGRATLYRRLAKFETTGAA